MDHETRLDQLKNILNEYTDLRKSISLLVWDRETYMPPGGAPERGEQVATLTRTAHQKFTTQEVGQLLEDLEPYTTEMDPDSDDARLIKVASRLYKKRSKVPANLLADIAKATSDAHLVWEEAREEANFNKFQPHLEKIVALRRQYAECFSPYDHIYDSLLDDYEPGMKTIDAQRIFASLKPQQVELIRAISKRPQINDSFLHQYYDVKDQWDFGVEVITRFGFDWKRGRQDESVHPFTQSHGIGDVRITTRFLQNYFPSAFFSTAHECGHGLYAQGINSNLSRTPLDNGASMSIHESQSRLYENIVGRSLQFWKHFYPRLLEYFPSQLGDVPLDTFYKAINKVEPSFIRVEADEATYNLHIMLRLELEIALIEGQLQVSDLPEAWDNAMQEYLGVTPADDAQGVLQDIHWSSGLFGYFPTYALGNLVGAQLWESLKKDIPDILDQIEAGEFESLTAWMKDKIHRHGAKFEPQELVQRITGSKIDPEPYVRYLTQKYTNIYQL
jgi:carboxypeptidase Taq